VAPKKKGLSKWLQALGDSSYFPEMQNYFLLNRIRVIEIFRSFQKGAGHDRAPRDFPFGPEPRRPIPIDSPGRWRCRKGRAFPGRDGDGALDRARAVNSTAASRTSHFQLERRRVAESPSRMALGQMRRRKRRGNFPACKPLKYHKTGKSSRSGAVMKTPSAGSPR
jgi:hypothetical protein